MQVSRVPLCHPERCSECPGAQAGGEEEGGRASGSPEGRSSEQEQGAQAAGSHGVRRGCREEGDMRRVSTWCRDARVILVFYPSLDPHQHKHPPRQSTGKAARLPRAETKS